MKLLNGFSLLLLEEIGQPIQPLIPFLLSSSQIKLEKMSPDNIPEKPDTNADNQTSGSRKTASPRPPEQPLLCPRCNSPNTKFCYFNNYNLTQPRHFCKTCRRYWTKGGALRNVPVGGGCRKNKRIKSASRLSGSSKDFAASSDSGVLKFFHGLSPAMEFQLGEGFPFSRHHFVSYGDLSTAPGAAATATVINPSCFYIDDAVASSGSLMGLNSNPSVLKQGESGGFNFNGGIQEMGSMNVQSSLASSIESLSCINQDLHWKLQQQRLATIFGGECEKDGGVSSLPPTLQENLTQKPQPISFQKLEISKQLVSAVSDPTNSGVSGPATTEGFFENSNNPATTNSNSSSSNWNGIQHWTDLHQYSEFP